LRGITALLIGVQRDSVERYIKTKIMLNSLKIILHLLVYLACSQCEHAGT